jgi:hypothetical protein
MYDSPRTARAAKTDILYKTTPKTAATAIAIWKEKAHFITHAEYPLN